MSTPGSGCCSSTLSQIKCRRRYSRTDCFASTCYYGITYLLARDINNEAAADFIASLASTELTLEIHHQEDYSRSAELLRQYSDAKVNFVDHDDRGYNGTFEYRARSHT